MEAVIIKEENPSINGRAEWGTGKVDQGGENQPATKVTTTTVPSRTTIHRWDQQQHPVVPQKRGMAAELSWNREEEQEEPEERQTEAE